MQEDVVERLKSFGCELEPGDQTALLFAVDKTVDTIRNECNVGEIPDGLRLIAVDIACGEFLLAKKRSGQLSGFDVENAVKQIKSGDTTVTYAIADGPAAVDGLIDWLINAGRSQFAAFRRFAW